MAEHVVIESAPLSCPLSGCESCRQVVEPIGDRTERAILAGRRAGVEAIRDAMDRIERHREASPEGERPTVAPRLAFWRWRVLRLGATEWQG